MLYLAILVGMLSGFDPSAPVPHAGSFRSLAPTSAAYARAPVGHTAVQELAGARAQRFQVFLLTMDQGDAVWERFGHNALVIKDHERGEELAWNWGLFDFDEVDFIPRFLRGTMRYQMGPFPVEPMVRSYIDANRSVYAHEIFLTDEEAETLDRLVRVNYRPENRAYTYHYYLDNCSTRIRDLLDQVLGGLLSTTFDTDPTAKSFRWHSRRLVQETTWVDQGLSFLLGMRGDYPRTRWENMFVPMEMMVHLEGLERPLEGGGTAPLMGTREVIHEADRPPPPNEAPGYSAVWLLLGLAGGAGVGALAGQASRGTRGGVAGLSVLVGFWGLFSGILGAILISAWFTDHDFIQANLNLFQTNPLGLLLMVVAPPALIRPGLWRGRWGRTAARLAVLIAILSAFAAMLQFFTPLHQGNAEVISIALPINLAVAWALARVSRAEPPHGSAARE